MLHNNSLNYVVRELEDFREGLQSKVVAKEEETSGMASKLADLNALLEVHWRLNEPQAWHSRSRAMH